MRRDDLVARVLGAHEALEREGDLSPLNPIINRALSALVDGVMAGSASPKAVARVLADPRVAAIRDSLVQRLALAESAMERHWAVAFCGRAHLSAADLGAFIYWDCYNHLVTAEIASLRPYLSLGAESLAFVGAGPLPLSAIILNLRTGLKVTCIDADAEACVLAEALCRKAALTGIEVVCASGADHAYRLHPVVLIASLVPDKADVMRRIQATRPAAVAGLRSAEGLSTLLYDPVDAAELSALGCTYLGCTGPNTRAISTTVLYRASPGCHGLPDARMRGGRPEKVPAAGQ